MEIGPHAGYYLFLEMISEKVVSLAWRGNLVCLPHVMRQPSIILCVVFNGVDCKSLNLRS
jgi:hypothetical protein